MAQSVAMSELRVAGQDLLFDKFHDVEADLLSHIPMMMLRVVKSP